MHDKAFNIAKKPKYDGYQSVLVSMVYKFFDKKTSGSGIKNENMSDQQLAEELHQPIIRKFEKRKVHSPFIDNIGGTNLADMHLISKFNKGFRFLLCVFDILKDKKVLQLLMLFKKFQKNLIANQINMGWKRQQILW